MHKCYDAAMQATRHRDLRPTCRALSLATLLLAATPAASCAEPASPRLLEQYTHTAWSALDDAPVDVLNFAQSGDGWLWLATATGLFRFDGKRFERMDRLSGQALLSTNVLALYAPPEGGLWIGYRFGGVSHWQDGKLTHYTEADGLPAGIVMQLNRGPDGVVWASTGGGLARLDGARFKPVGPEAGLPVQIARQVLFDRQGTQWVSVYGNVYFRRKGESRFHPAWPKGDLMGMAEAPDGTIWASDAVDSYYRMSAAAPADGAPARRALPGNGMHFDRDGAMWLMRVNSLERRVAGQAPSPRQQLTVDHGLSGGLPQCFFQDREGNVWVGTSAGVDRFRRNRLVSVPVQSDFDHAAIVPAPGNGVWAGDFAGAWRQLGSDGERSVVRERPVASLFRAADGTVWAGDDKAIWHRDGARMLEHIPLPKDLQGYPVHTIHAGADGGLWVSVARRGLFLLKQGKWLRNGGLADLPDRHAFALHLSAAGTLWAGYTRNQIARIDGARVAWYSSLHGLDLGTVLVLYERDGQLWAGGESGVAWFDGQRFHMLRGLGGDSFRSVSGLVRTKTGDLWLFGSDGLSHISAAELNGALRQPEREVAFERFDARDGLIGLPSTVRPLSTLLEAQDGKLWFSTASKVGWIDPAKVARNPRPPPVLIQGVTADTRRYDAQPGLVLPQDTSNLRIDFTALSLSMPERVRFRYRLDGVDNDWQNPGTRRQAFYTNLAPGQYRFRVMAANEDGVWNQQEAQLAFRIQPTTAQAAWFQALVAMAVLAALYLVYQLRLQQVTRQLRKRMEDRIDERERIARALHDTFLQSVQGLMLRFQTLLKRLPPEGEARVLAERILDQADQVLIEGRNQVRGLRSTTLAVTDLPQACAELGRSLQEQYDVPFRMAVSGHPVTLAPAAAEHIYAIASEALHNACRHARAGQVELELAYGGEHFRLRVRDDGRGIDAEVLAAGQRPGHWGLTGMREQAGKLEAEVELWSAPGKGTEVSLRVPAPNAYLVPPRRTLVQRVTSWLARMEA
jgi:signal transduction histidine kinase/ligand-binding sensor domain-containing protein